MPMQRDISTDQDWTTFRNPQLRDADEERGNTWTFRTSAAGEKTTVGRRPANPIEALMQTAPGDTPEVSAAELQPLREAVAAAVERLGDEHRYIIEAIHHERIHYSELAKRLGVKKTQAFRLTKVAEAELQAQLLLDPKIHERITMTNTWNEAAHERVLALAPYGRSLADDVARRMVERKIDLVRQMVKAGERDINRLGAPLVTIGLSAAAMLDNRGMWNVDEMTALLCRKQHDYGHANINAFGIIGVGVRCSDKVARFVNLTDKNATGTAEPLEDALLDMVGYAVIAMMLMDDVFNLELEVTS